jgi:hypothetical protein
MFRLSLPAAELRDRIVGQDLFPFPERFAITVFEDAIPAPRCMRFLLGWDPFFQPRNLRREGRIAREVFEFIGVG